MQQKNLSIRSQKGFTLVELVLYIVLSAFIVGVISQIMLAQVSGFSFVSTRQSAITDVRYALNRITNELIRLRSEDILSIAADNLMFVDSSSNVTSFHMGISDGKKVLYRGNEFLLSPIENFEMAYYDENDNPVFDNEDIDQIRRFEISIKTAPVAEEGSITLSTVVTPRNFIYENYEQ